ncbi:MAG: DUF4296 domain-containing protein [Bacteroidales bacterium]
MRLYQIILISVCLTVLACARVPEGVLDNKKMEQVLYDVHIAEGIMDEFPSQYRTLESKQKLMAGVFRENAITKAEFDSSMVYYGANLDQYMKIYQRVTERLNAQRDLLTTELTAYEKSLLTPVGDSADLWRKPAQFILDPALLATTRIVEIKGDSNFREKDKIVWSMRFNNLPPDSVAYAYLALGYQKGSESEQLNAFPVKNGRVTLELNVLPELNTGMLFGTVSMISRCDSPRFAPVYIDSVSMMRYHHREVAAADSLATTLPADSLDQNLPDSVLPVQLQSDSLSLQK